MLDLLTSLLKKASKLDANKLMRQSLNNTAIQQEILDLNRLDQLYDKGIDAKDDSLGEYSPATIEGTANFLGKKQKGQRYDHITLNDTGEFYDSYIFKNEKDGFIIQADTIKSGGQIEMTSSVPATKGKKFIAKFEDTDLADVYGKDIIGLNNGNKSKLAGWLIEPMQKGIKKELGT